MTTCLSSRSAKCPTNSLWQSTSPEQQDLPDLEIRSRGSHHRHELDIRTDEMQCQDAIRSLFGARDVYTPMLCCGAAGFANLKFFYTHTYILQTTSIYTMRPIVSQMVALPSGSIFTTREVLRGGGSAPTATTNSRDYASDDQEERPSSLEAATTGSVAKGLSDADLKTLEDHLGKAGDFDDEGAIGWHLQKSSASVVLKIGYQILENSKSGTPSLAALNTELVTNS